MERARRLDRTRRLPACTSDARPTACHPGRTSRCACRAARISDSRDPWFAGRNRAPPVSPGRRSKTRADRSYSAGRITAPARTKTKQLPARSTRCSIGSALEFCPLGVPSSSIGSASIVPAFQTRGISLSGHLFGTAKATYNDAARLGRSSRVVRAELKNLVRTTVSDAATGRWPSDFVRGVVRSSLLRPGRSSAAWRRACSSAAAVAIVRRRRRRLRPRRWSPSASPFNARSPILPTSPAGPTPCNPSTCGRA